MQIDAVSWLIDKKLDDTVLLVLNRPITDIKRFRQAWKACEHHAVLDGAANSLIALGTDEFKPDFIIGDCDSISDKAKDHFKEIGVPVLKVNDQDSTDFMKGMHESMSRWPTTKQFLAFGAIGGRLDHSFHSIYCCSLAHERYNARVILLSEQNVTFMIPDEGTIATPRSFTGPAVGLIPILGPAKITTKGLEWDVTDWETSFTTRMSTSNYLVADTVEVKSTIPILFTLEIPKQSS